MCIYTYIYKLYKLYVYTSQWISPPQLRPRKLRPAVSKKRTEMCGVPREDLCLAAWGPKGRDRNAAQDGSDGAIYQRKSWE